MTSPDHPTGIRWRMPVATGLAALAAVAGAGPAAAAPPAAPGVSVIVMEHARAGAAPEAAVQRLGGRVNRQLPLIHGFTASVPDAAVRALRRSTGVVSVTRDRSFTLRSTDTAVPAPGASLDVVRATIGASPEPTAGSGVDVALVDTGVAPVPALDGRVVNGPDLSADADVPGQRYLDGFGHGTHMAGIIAGSDPATGFSGVAPGSRVVNVRVADHQGGTSLSRLLAAIDWVGRFGNRGGLHVRVLTLAVGADVSGSYRDDPMAAAVEEAWQRGIAVVVAAGNSGLGSGGLDSPAHDPYVIAAGASDDVRTANPVDDVMAEFSSAGDGTRNPDVVAPGVGIVSLRVPGAWLDVQFPQARIGDANFRGSGTSQAAAVASGAVAQLASARPDLDPDSLKAVLRAAARPLPGVDALLQGTGVVDVAQAKTLAVPAEARQRWARARRGGAWRIRNAAALQLAVENPAAWPANKWLANTMRGDRWLANTMRGDRWLANTMRSDTWLANTMRSDRWSSNTWNGATFTANQWTSAGWDATP